MSNARACLPVKILKAEEDVTPFIPPVATLGGEPDDERPDVAA